MFTTYYQHTSKEWNDLKINYLGFKSTGYLALKWHQQEHDAFARSSCCFVRGMRLLHVTRDKGYLFDSHQHPLLLTPHRQRTRPTGSKHFIDWNGSQAFDQQQNCSSCLVFQLLLIRSLQSKCSRLLLTTDLTPSDNRYDVLSQLNALCS